MASTSASTPPGAFDLMNVRPEEKASGENFPVAPRFLPAGYRRHLMAVYGFARMVDDIGDEAPESDRIPLLDLVTDDLALMRAGKAKVPVVRALRRTVVDCEIPLDPFLRLVAANRQDQTVHRYDTFERLVEYCELSANPVGHIMLHVFGAMTPRRAYLSDQVCTALQILEHAQDVGEDLARGRVYLPQDDLGASGCTEADLARAEAPPRLRAVVALQAGRARRLLDSGARLTGTLSGFPRLLVAGFVAGGRATAAALRQADHEVLGRRVRPGKGRTAAEWGRTFVTGT
jgi:squalene synthase HpnC